MDDGLHSRCISALNSSGLCRRMIGNDDGEMQTVQSSQLPHIPTLSASPSVMNFMASRTASMERSSSLSKPCVILIDYPSSCRSVFNALIFA